MNLKEAGINILTRIGAIDPIFRATNVYDEGHFSIKDEMDKFIAERRYPSKLDALKSAGRERFFAKLEWALGASAALLGPIMLRSVLDPSFESYIRGEKTLLAIGLLLGASYTMAMGKERRGISGAIIRKIRHDQSPN